MVPRSAQSRCSINCIGLKNKKRRDDKGAKRRKWGDREWSSLRRERGNLRAERRRWGAGKGDFRTEVCMCIQEAEAKAQECREWQCPHAGMALKSSEVVFVAE